MTNPPYPLHDIPFQKTSSQWHQTLPGDTEIFASPDAYQQWNATGRPFRPPADTPRQRNPQDSWKPIMSGEMESWSYSTPEAREPIQGFQRRGYQSSPNGSSASRAISPPRQGGLSSPAGFQHTAYVPPRRRGMAPFPPTLPPGTQPVSNRTPANIPFIPFNSSSSGGSREYTPASPFVVKLPPAPYIELSKRSKANSSSDKIVAKLLVLDLNGTLIYRSASRQSGDRRKAYPRPYLSCFLEYLFLPEPWDSDKPPVRPWEVFVWSSAQPINVRAMVEFGFGKKWIEGVYEPESETGRAAREQNGEGRLLGVWARDRMGLHEADYARKVQTVKDLRKPIEHLKHPDQENPDRPAHRFDERTTLLLDDSPRKAAFQPWSQIVVPEYDKAEYQSSKAAALHFEEDGFADRSGMDEILLGVVGLLEELRSVENVPAWVRAGGLTRQKDVAKIGVEVQSAGAEWITAEEPTLHRLPSHESFSHWYQTPAVLHYWTERGRQALIRKGIEINSGIDVNSLDSPAPLPRFIPPYMNHASSLSEINNFSRALKNAPKPRPRQRWSPSRPASAEPEDQNEPSPILKGQSPLPQQVRRPYSTATLIHEADFSAAALASVHIDQWRTFRAVDVSRYLADVADRPSPLDEQRRALLLQAVEVLQSLAPDSTFDDPSPSAKLAEQGFFPNMCDTCTLTAGHGATKRRNEGVRAAATVIGLMADKVTAPPGKAKKVPRKIAKAKRGPTSGKIKKGPTKRLPGKAKKTAAPGTNQQPISRDPTWGKPTMSGQIVPTTQPLVGQQAVRSKETTLEAATSARGDQKVAVFAPSPESQNSTQLEPHKVDLPFEFLEPSLRLKYQGLAMEVRRLQVNLDTDTRLATRMAQQGKQVPSYNGVLTNNTAKRQNRENHLASTLARLPEPVRDSLLRGDLPTSTSDGAPFGTSTAQMSSGVSTIQSSSASESLGMKPSRHLKASKCNREASACVCRWEAEVGGNKAGPSNVNGADSEQMDLPQQGVWKSLPRGAKNRGRVAMHETVNKLGTFDDGDEFKTKPGPSLRTRSRSLAESVSTGEKRRLDAMASQAEERELADDEVAEILFPWPDIPVAGEVEE